MSKRQRIGIFLPTWVGDVVMATPTVRALRTGFPDVELIGVMRPIMVELLAGTTMLDGHLLFEKNKREGLPTRVGLVSTLRAAKLDALVLLTKFTLVCSGRETCRNPENCGLQSRCKRLAADRTVSSPPSHWYGRKIGRTTHD